MNPIDLNSVLGEGLPASVDDALLSMGGYRVTAIVHSEVLRLLAQQEQ